MIEKISSIKGRAIATRVDRFNATLPILLKVLSQTKEKQYMLQVGNKVVQSKSYQPLQVGQNYYAIMRYSSLGEMMLTSLKAEVKFEKSPLSLEWKEIKELLAQERGEELKQFGLDGMLRAQSKEEFVSFGYFMLGLQKKILSFRFVDDEDKECHIQLKKQKKFLEFFALYPHLGAISGKLYDNQGVILELRVQFESVVEFLRKHIGTLREVGEVRLMLQDKITPLFVPQESLLDLKI
ncbi:hypothetical protein BBW65_01155 [Helicobacter enhydrae]|uniref:Uncharacterized protein n=1 Tax=Helicobacter enhydrae TaxID=222136 RepID=A0A1B1U3Z2_9HELI|nr:hypothetical protein [Helicobacter enhydrae]ANV97504.1 hypothetical protein BBW65_01155 [Helicobacter enhydrae]